MCFTAMVCCKYCLNKHNKKFCAITCQFWQVGQQSASTINSVVSVIKDIAVRSPKPFEL